MPHPTPGPDHAAHDPLLLAAYAAGDAEGAQLDEAAALVATCAACAALHHDLRAIALALPAAAATPPSPRPRDFRLTPGQAAALHPSGWRRLLAPLAGPSFAFARPLGTGLATIGLAGVLVAGAAGIPLGGAASAPAATDTASVPMAASEVAASPAGDQLYGVNAAATEAPAAGGDGGPGSVPEPSPAGTVDERTSAGEVPTGPSGGPEEQQPTGTDDMLTAAGAPALTEAAPTDAGEAVMSPGTTAPQPTALVAAGGLAALAAGLALLALRFAARRLT